MPQKFDSVKIDGDWMSGYSAPPPKSFLVLLSSRSCCFKTVLNVCVLAYALIRSSLCNRCNPLIPCSAAKTVKKKKEKKKKKKWANDGTKEDLFVAIVVLCETILLCVYV